jgi:hypothetical protein
MFCQTRHATVPSRRAAGEIAPGTESGRTFWPCGREGDPVWEGADRILPVVRAVLNGARTRMGMQAIQCYDSGIRS